MLDHRACRALPLFIVALLVCGCSGGTAGIGIPSTNALRAPIAIAAGDAQTAKPKIAVKPASLNFSELGNAQARSVEVSETRYKGKFAARGCTVAKAEPASGKGPGWKLKVVPLRFGSCTMTFTDDRKNSAKLPILVSSASPSPTPSATPSPTPTASAAPTPTATATPTPVASPAAIYVSYSTSASSGTIAAFDEQGHLESVSGSWSNAGEPFQLAYDAQNGLLYAAGQNTTPQINAYSAQGVLQTLAPGFGGADTVFAFAIDSHNRDLYVSHQIPSGCTSACTNLLSAYDADGNSVATPGGFSGFTFAAPDGMTFDGHNDLLYVVNGTTSIAVYDEQGNAQAPSGGFAQPSNCPSSGSNAGYPQSIAFDTLDDLVYVGFSDCNGGDGAIAAYDENGTLQTLSGSFAHLGNPSGIAVDTHNGFLYVSNSLTNTVMVYDAQGNQQSTAGSFNPGFSFGLNASTNGIAVIPPQTASVRRRGHASHPRHR